MEQSSRLTGVITFAASIAVGFGAAVAIAGAAAVSQAAPTLRHVQPMPDAGRLDPVVFAMIGAAAVSQAGPTLHRVQPAPDVVRLDPVVVTVSKKYFDAIRNEETAVARTGGDRKVARG